jgi:hypothetical protein
MTTANEIAPYEGGQLDSYRPQIMTPEAARALDEQVRLCTRAVLREGTDYGIIPGTSGEKSLWRPGAQKLLQWFSLECTCERIEVERDDQGRKHGITYRAEVGRGLKTATPVILATCEGTADYDESKFSQPAEEVQRKAEYNERKWAKQYGRVADPTKWKDRGEYRADWNALMKRAQKRAIVGATVDATASGGIFADREDDDPPVPAGDGPSWYEQALEQALTFTTQEDGRRLYAEAAHAGRDGMATRRQVDHVQNRIRQRAERLKTHIQADVEDLTPASEDASPAGIAQPTPPAADQVPPPAGEAPARPPAKATSGQVTAIDRKMRELGYGDEPDENAARLRATARLANRKGELATTKDLTQPQAALVRQRIDDLTDPAALHALLDDLREAEMQDAAGEPDGQ